MHLKYIIKSYRNPSIKRRDGIANCVDKFVPKLATICKLLQTGGSAYRIRTGDLRLERAAS